MSQESGTRRGRFWAGYAAVAISFTVFALEATRSAAINPRIRAERIFVEAYLRDHAPDLEQERRLAEAYWSRYPHVRADDVFGPAGMGIAGARAHYERHGRQEGLRWGLE